MKAMARSSAPRLFLNKKEGKTYGEQFNMAKWLMINPSTKDVENSMNQSEWDRLRENASVRSNFNLLKTVDQSLTQFL